jgi:DinB family protein
MNHELIAPAIGKLADTPVRLRHLFEQMDVAKLRVKPAPKLFSPLEDMWHLHDIEWEGYSVRIRRMLTEELPVLESLDGDRMAILRRYNELQLPAALAGFAAARAESLRLLEGLPAQAWTRRAEFENRWIDLRDLIDMMIEHDQGHLSSIRGVYVASIAA